ncbi:MAG: DUF2235 domain-containing protein [Pseudomonadota bacterium]
MKRIVILCDGTWNSSDTVDATNVRELTRVIVAQTRTPKMREIDGVVEPILDAAGAPALQDVAQVPIYIEGVGTGRRGVTRTGRLSDRLLGGAFGWGLMENVVEAYRNLVFLWESGDEVYIFGYSRGAFTARSLAGFIRYTGLLSRSDLHLLPKAVDRYSDTFFGSGEARQAKNLWWRAKYSSETLVDPEDIKRLEAMPADPEAQEALAKLSRAPEFKVDYMGVWDTVGAMGIPGHVTGAPLVNRRHQFHDTNLSAMVRSARHAVALDERRRTFPPTLWKNIGGLNKGRPDRPYRQEWFPGNHGSVGGGGPEKGLSSAALDWVLDGAEIAGLALRDDLRKEIRDQINTAAPLTNKPIRAGLVGQMRAMFGADRDGPDLVQDTSGPTRARWRLTALDGVLDAHGPWPYRPRSLDRVRQDMDRLDD